MTPVTITYIRIRGGARNPALAPLEDPTLAYIIGCVKKLILLLFILLNFSFAIARLDVCKHVANWKRGARCSKPKQNWSKKVVFS